MKRRAFLRAYYGGSLKVYAGIAVAIALVPLVLVSQASCGRRVALDALQEHGFTNAKAAWTFRPFSCTVSDDRMNYDFIAEVDGEPTHGHVCVSPTYPFGFAPAIHQGD